MAEVMSFLLCVVLAISVHFASASPPPPASDCSAVIEGVTDCLQFVGVGDNVTQPDPNGQCCTALKSALRRPEQVMCLCVAINDAIEGNFTFDMTRLSGLTLACHAPNGFDPRNCPATPSGQAHPVAPMAPPSPPSISPTSTGGGPVHPPPAPSSLPPPFHNEPVPAPPPKSVTPPPTPPSSYNGPISSPPMASSPPPVAGSAFNLASSTVATVLLSAIAAVAA